MGKATNLTNRLSTYNKSDEHEVVWYKSCGTKADMNMVEPMVFKKLNECREQANRERFVLPVGETVDYFTRVVEEVVGFVLWKLLLWYYNNFVVGVVNKNDFCKFINDNVIYVYFTTGTQYVKNFGK